MQEMHGIVQLERPVARPRQSVKSPDGGSGGMQAMPPPPNGQPFGQVGKWQKRKPKQGHVDVKTIKCGVCVVPPAGSWGKIQSIRSGNDRHFGKWMPHINLRYPVYLTEKQLEALPGILKEALSDAQPFKVRLDSFGTFQHPLSTMLWAGPTAGDYELRQLHYMLTQLFPRHSDGGTAVDNVEEAGREFTPHLCLGQWRDDGEMHEVWEGLKGDWEVVEWEVSQVYVVTGERADSDSVGIKFGVSLTGAQDWVPFACPIDLSGNRPPTPPPPVSGPRHPKFQKYAEPLSPTPPATGPPIPQDEQERRRLALLAASLHELKRGELPPRGGVRGVNGKGRGVVLPVGNQDDLFTVLKREGEARQHDSRSRSAGGTPRFVQAPHSTASASASESSDDWDAPTYEEYFMPAEVEEEYQRPQVLRAPALYDRMAQSRILTFADLPERTYNRRTVAVPARPTLEDLILEHAQTSLHGMKSRLQPLAAKILASGTEEERTQLGQVVEKRKAAVERREKQLGDKQVFNRKVATAIGAPKGQVSLLQLREYTWQSVIVEARREFVVNKLRLEAFESEEAQARRWAIAMGRDVLQQLTLLDKEGVKALIADTDKWARVKDVMQTQACLKLEQSIISLLETADLDASDDLAFDYIMAVTDFGFGQRVQWDEHVNSRRQSAQFRLDVNNVPGWYVYYDIYGWC